MVNMANPCIVQLAQSLTETLRSACDIHPPFSEKATNTSTKQLSNTERVSERALASVDTLGKDHSYHIKNITKRWLEKMNSIEMDPLSTDETVLFLLNKATDRDARVFSTEPEAQDFHLQYIITYARKAVSLVAASDSSLPGIHRLENRRASVDQFVIPDFTLLDNGKPLVTIEDKLNKVLSPGKRKEIVNFNDTFPAYTYKDLGKTSPEKLDQPPQWQRILIQVLILHPS